MSYKNRDVVIKVVASNDGGPSTKLFIGDTLVTVPDADFREGIIGAAEMEQRGKPSLSYVEPADLTQLGKANDRLHYRVWALSSGATKSESANILHDPRNTMAMIGIVLQEQGLTERVFDRIKEITAEPTTLMSMIVGDLAQSVGEDKAPPKDGPRYRLSVIAPHDIDQDVKYALWLLDDADEMVDVVYDADNEAEIRAWVKSQGGEIVDE